MMVDQVEAADPEEACGLLAGRFEPGGSDCVEAVLPITNRIHSPVRFFMDPVEQLAAFNWIESQGLELIGIYHSHPAGPPVPSVTDLGEYSYPGVIYLIWFRADQGWQVNAFAINQGDYVEITLDLVDSCNSSTGSGL